MHIEILVEDSSGKKALEALVPKIIGEHNTYRLISYKGIGHIPKNMKGVADPRKRILLANLPRLLKGYGKTYSGAGYKVTVVVVCDLDRKNLRDFLADLNQILEGCDPKPATRFCIAIEEGEAWFLGDPAAIKSAYPNADAHALSAYVNDSICGTWERLADAVYPGGSKALARKAWHVIGAEKTRWAEDIAPRMNVERNQSPSFCFFRDQLRSL